MKSTLTFLMLVFLITSIVLGIGWYLCSRKTCPEIEHVNEFIEKKPEPISVEPVIDPKFDELFSEPTKPHAKKPTLKQKVTGRHNYHKVKKGENLYRIGLKYKVPYQFLMEVNGFKKVDIEAGQWIYLGTKEERQRFISKLVGKADSLYTYNDRYYPGKDTMNFVDVYTQSTGRVVNQAVDFHLNYEVKKSLRFGLGVELSTNSMTPYAVKGGFLNKNTLFTGGVGLGEKTTVTFGIMKLIK